MERPVPVDVEREVTAIDMIVSKANEAGDITYANPIFFKISGYSQGELLDQPHAILRHPDMPKVIFKYLWDNLKAGHEVFAYVKNLCKDGSYYWVLAQVRVAKNPDGSFRNYVSTRRNVKSETKERIAKLYEELKRTEEQKSIEAAEKSLEAWLTENGQSFDTFNTFMQQLNK